MPDPSGSSLQSVGSVIVIIRTIAVISIAIFLLACSSALPRQVSPAAGPSAAGSTPEPTATQGYIHDLEESRRQQLCRRPRHLARRHHALGRARPPAVATETLPAGGDRQHELRPSPAGRSVILTARTPSHRCRRPPHRPNHHRASPAAGCPAIPLRSAPAFASR